MKNNRTAGRAVVACALIASPPLVVGADWLTTNSERIILANIIGDTDQFGNVDGRGSLTEKAEQLGLSEAEVERIRGVSGWVVCSGKAYDNPDVGSGVLVGSNMQVLTAVHLFIDKKGRKREPLSECHFVPQSAETDGELSWVYFDFDSGNYKLGTEAARPRAGNPYDYAVVALKKPIPGAIPFRYDAHLVQEGTWVLGVTAGQTSPAQTFSDKEPVVQQCRVRDQHLIPAAPMMYITDCDLSPIGSGGPILARDDKGELVVRGIFITAGKPALDGKPYDLSTGSFAAAVSTTGPVGLAIESVRDALPKKGVTFAK